MITIGIDPSLRHTAICRRLVTSETSSTRFAEIEPKAKDIYTAIYELRKGLRKYLPLYGEPHAYAIERQLVQGIFSAATMYLVQHVVIEEILELYPQVRIMMPGIAQLGSYQMKVWGAPTKKTPDLIKHWRATHPHLPPTTKVSEHMIDAYCLAHLAGDALLGKFKYELTKKGQPLFPNERLQYR